MAIIGNIEAYIRVKGKQLHEYLVNIDNDPDRLDVDRKLRKPSDTLSRSFVEAEAGQNFCLVYRLLPGFEFGKGNCLSCDLNIDGDFADNDILGKSWRTFVVEGKYHQDGDKWLEQKFRFGQLIGNEELRRNHEFGKEKDLGEIKMTAWLAKGKADSNEGSDAEGDEESDIDSDAESDEGNNKSDGESEGTGDVAKTADTTDRASAKTVNGKGVELQTNFDDAKETAPWPILETTKVENAPMATFIFYYRSTDILKKMGLVGGVLPLRERPVQVLDVRQARQVLQEYEAQPEDLSCAITKQRAGEVALHLRRLEKRKRSTGDDDNESDLEEIPCPKQLKNDRQTSFHDEVL